MTRDRLVISEHPITGGGPEAWCTLRRAVLLARSGGGRVASPSGLTEWPPLPGLRHEVFQVSVGAPAYKVREAVAEQTGPLIDRLRPSLVHVIGVGAAAAAVIRRRAGLRVVVEPGVMPSHRLRALDPPPPADRIAALVELEEATLTRADAVIARSTVEAAVLARRGVPRQALWTVREAVPDLDAPGPPSELPHLVFVGDTAPWSGWRDLLDALQRVQAPWRLTMVFEDGSALRTVRQAIASRGLEARITLASAEDASARVASARVVVCALRESRAVEAGAVVPWAAQWALSAGRPLIAPDVPVARAYAGPAAHYFDAGDAGRLAEAIESLLTDPHRCADLATRAGELGAARLPAETDALIQDLWRGAED